MRELNFNPEMNGIVTTLTGITVENLNDKTMGFAKAMSESAITDDKELTREVFKYVNEHFTDDEVLTLAVIQLYDIINSKQKKSKLEILMEMLSELESKD